MGWWGGGGRFIIWSVREKDGWREGMEARGGGFFFFLNFYFCTTQHPASPGRGRKGKGRGNYVYIPT